MKIPYHSLLLLISCSLLSTSCVDKETRKNPKTYATPAPLSPGVPKPSDASKNPTSLTTEKELFSLSKPFLQLSGAKGVKSITYSADSTLLATGDQDGSLCLFNAKTGAFIRKLSGHIQSITGIAFAPDGKQLLSTSSDATARLWEVDSGTELHQYKAPMGIDAMALSPNGQQFLTGDQDGTLLHWNIVDGSILQNISMTGGWNRDDLQRTDRIHSIAFLPDGNTAITSSNVSGIKSWHLPTGQKMRTFPSSGGYCLSISKDGTRVAAVSRLGLERIIDVWGIQIENELEDVAMIKPNSPTYKTYKNQKDSWNDLYAIWISPDGTQVVAGFSDSIRAWDLPSKTEVFRIPRHNRHNLAGKLLDLASDVLPQKVDTRWVNKEMTFTISPDLQSLAMVEGSQEYVTLWKTEGLFQK